MICATCFGTVEWCGPLSAFTHTQCKDCGAINNQMVDEAAPDDEDEPEEAQS